MTNTESNILLFDIPSSSSSYYLRYAANETEEASKVTGFTILAKPSAPSISFNSTNEIFTGLTTGMEVRVNDGVYGPVDDYWISGNATSNVIESLSPGESAILNFRKVATSSAPLSNEKAIALYSRLEKPTTIEFNPVTYVLTGTSSSMQYRVKGAATWTSISSTSVDLSNLINISETVVEVRYKPTSTNSASQTVDITLPKQAPAPSGLSLDLANELITGCVTEKTYQYSTNDSSWTNVTATDGSFSITGLISTSAKTLYVREAATSTTPYTDSVQFSIPARPATPNVSINTTTELLSGVTTGQEISINGSAYSTMTSEMVTAYSNGTAVSNLIDDIESGDSTTLSFRVLASVTDSASNEKVITLNSRLEKPTMLEFNPVTYVLTGTSSSMQYRVKGAATWTSISSISVNLSSLINNISETVIEVRYKPTSTNSASQTVDITLPKQAPAPSGLSVDLANELIIGCVIGKTYQYSTNGSSWTNVTATDGSFSITSLISTSAKTLYVREAATSTTPYTDSVQFSIPARSAAHSIAVVKMIYDDPLHPDKAVLTELDSTMEYKLSSESNWTSFNGVNPAFDIPTSSKTYYVRYKGTSDGFPSNNTSVTLATRTTAPSVTINTTTEFLSGITTGRELNINGGAYTTVTSEMVAAYSSGTAVSDLINDVESGNSTTLSFRVPASATKPASNEKVIILYARASAPSLEGLAYNALNRRITGTSSSMLWRVPGGSWSTCSTYITSPTGATQIEFAMKATSSASRSWVATFYIVETDAEAMPQNNIKESLMPDESPILEETKDENSVDLTPNADEKIPSEDIGTSEIVNDEQSQSTETTDFETQDGNPQE